ncbi:hypothetical protein [Klebsiella sp. BIGb0407]|uniref:hypothetical protein n=1 Tax=Klebsiella sp. BIGb0407 TaxID=2940603 RepID=UPI00216A2ADE|nr:hypothetical protein [Klebsiella sp. BIGb0407]MCS3434118.1 hypothetical protein [Klebsiella sp. BIGb0407]
MQESTRFIIAVILLSIGGALIPGHAKSTIAVKSGGMSQTISYQEQQHGDDLSKRLPPQWRYSAEQWGTARQAKSPALLWHRFSLTPQPVFFHWVMAMWSQQAAFVLLVP